MLYTVERMVKDETDGYGKAGEVQWRLMSPEGECIEVYPLRRLAKAKADELNKDVLAARLAMHGIFRG